MNGLVQVRINCKNCGKEFKHWVPRAMEQERRAHYLATGEDVQWSGTCPDPVCQETIQEPFRSQKKVLKEIENK